MTIADDRPDDPDVRPAIDALTDPVDGAMDRTVRFGIAYRWAIAAALGILTVAIVGYAVYTVRAVLVQVIIALFIAVSLDPAVRLLIRRGVKRSIAVAIIFVLALAVHNNFVWSLVPPLVHQGTELY